MPTTRAGRPPRTRSTAEQRRETVLAAAVQVFSGTGYHATAVSTVAAAAGISEGYVFRLFGDKQALFVAALDRCFGQIREALEAGAGRAPAASPVAVLEAMAVAYARLIAQRELLMLQVQALAAVDDPVIRAALRRGEQSLVELVRRRSGADAAAVQEFFARGQLCHLVTALGLVGADSSDEADGAGEAGAQAWAGVLTAGIRHYEAPR